MKKFNELNDQEKFECVNLFYDFLLRSITALCNANNTTHDNESLSENEKYIANGLYASMTRNMAQFVKYILERYQFSDNDTDAKILEKIIELDNRCGEFFDSIKKEENGNK